MQSSGSPRVLVQHRGHDLGGDYVPAPAPAPGQHVRRVLSDSKITFRATGAPAAVSVRASNSSARLCASSTRRRRT